MEVMGNNSLLQKPETQACESNYNCRLPRDLNVRVNTSSKYKGDADVGLLVACKVQLSSEVIRWKTESLRLQKERDSAQQRSKELDQMVSKLVDTTKELEGRLAVAEDENKHLRSRSMVSEEEKAVLVQKLSLNFNKYHSFPGLDSCGKQAPSRLSRDMSEFRNSYTPQDDWREVSQKMLHQMKQEMKELQEMSARFCNHQEKENLTKSLPNEIDIDCKEELQEGLSSLLSETESLKHHLLQQKRKLKSVINTFVHDSVHQSWDSRNGTRNSSNGDIQNSPSKHKPVQRLSRQSDETYRDYFTRQLETTNDLNKINNEMQLVLKHQETCTLQEVPSSTPHSSPSRVLQHPHVEQERSPTVQEEKVCPICQKSFGITVPQVEFEDHVVNHLEAESASLLDQYVVL